MKRILSLVLALMMLALCPAMAETAAQVQTLTSPKGDYSLDVPQDYFPMDAELMMGLLTTPEMQQLMAQMMGLEDASQLSVYFEALEANNMMIVYTPDWGGNFNVQATESALTMAQLVSLKSMMDAAMVMQYTSMGIAEEDIQMMDIQEIAGRKWYGVQMVMVGIPMQTMLTIENGVQYTLTFSAMEADVMNAILESFKVLNVIQ